MTKAGAEIKAEAFVQALRLSRRFKAPREAVFRAFTDPGELAQWFGPEGVGVNNVKIDLRPGGAYSLEFRGKDGEVHPLYGIYREVREPDRLVFTWTWSGGGMAGVETLITIEFADADGETELTLVHEGLPSQESQDHHSQGWTSSFTCLDQLLAQGGAS